MNELDPKIKTVYRILAGICSILLVFALAIEIFVAETKSWSFLISGSLLLLLFSYVTIQGKVPKWFRSINS